MNNRALGLAAACLRAAWRGHKKPGQENLGPVFKFIAIGAPVSALALRGSSLLFSSIAMRTMGPFLLMGTRFLIAFVIEVV